MRKPKTRTWKDRADAIGAELRQAQADHEAGRPEAAERRYRAVLARDPGNGMALHALGILACQAGQYAPAIALIEQALGTAPADGGLHNSLAIARWKLGQRAEAVAGWRRALALAPRSVEAHVNLAVACNATGDREEAVRLYELALALDPRSPLALNNLALLRLGEGQIDTALALCVRALETRRDLETLTTLGTVLRAAGRLAEALAAFEDACRLAPTRAPAHLGRAAILRMLGRPEEALALCRRAVELDPASVPAADALLFTLLYVPALEPAVYLAEHLRWDARHGLTLAGRRRPHANGPDPERPLRIGYLSPDFREHAVAHFAGPLLAGHDRARVTVVGYASVSHPDAVTARLAGLADLWRDVSTLDDEAVADLVRADGIDVLVDLACHTGGNRLPVFARKPAPVQVSHNVTPSGLSAMDYLIADAHLAPGLPPGALAETVVRLPGCFTCYAPPPDAPAPAPAPARARGAVTFGSFNNLAKLNAEVIALWAQVLRAVPDARLLLKSSLAVDGDAHAATVAAFAAHGVGDRVACLPRTAGAGEHLALYAEVDVALDPFPFNGHTTTCEALWMGVPVVTLAGRLFADRVGVSLLHAIGLPELVAETPEAYVTLAAELASDVERLHAVRGALRAQVAGSSLCDAAGYARRLDAAYREMWRRWCAAAVPTSFHAHRLPEHPAQAS